MPRNASQLSEIAPGIEELERDAVFALATADDLESGMAVVVESIHRETGAERIEWWAADDEGGIQLSAAAGRRHGDRRCVPIGGAGTFVLRGGDPELDDVLKALTPVIRRRTAERRLTRTAVQLAQRNEALEDFAALVAHELKNPLHAALLADDPSRPVEDALALVDTLLEAAHAESDTIIFTSVEEPLRQASDEVGAGLVVTTDLATALPLASDALHVILRNLLSNAVAAGAQHVHVSAVRSASMWSLFVDDDGIGLGDADGYASGSGLGLTLCRRIAARFGGSLRLAPHPLGGTRAELEFTEVSR
jgi:signal transduction histidine kinase